MKLVKLKADWCAPCRTLTTMLDGFNECPIEEINIGLEPEKAVELGVKSIPTLILLNDNGQEIWRRTGLIDRIELESVIKKLKKNEA